MSCRRERKKHLETRVPNEKKVFWLITDIIEIENDSVLIRPALKCYPRLGMSCSWAFFGTVYRYLWFFINFWWQLWSATILIRPAPRCHPRLGMGPRSCSEELGATTTDRWGTSQGIHPNSLLDSLSDSLLAFAPLRPSPLCCPITEFWIGGIFCEAQLENAIKSTNPLQQPSAST